MDLHAIDEHALVLVDPSGVIRWWSDGATKAFGYFAIHAVGQSLDLIVPPEYREAHWTGFHHAVKAGAASIEGQKTEFPVLCADQGVKVFWGMLSLLRSSEGHVIGLMVIFGPEAALAPTE